MFGDLLYVFLISPLSVSIVTQAMYFNAIDKLVLTYFRNLLCFFFKIHFTAYRLLNNAFRSVAFVFVLLQSE